MAPVAPILMAGMKYLPVLGSVVGAVPGLRRGNLGEAALGAGFGALTGGTAAGPLTAATKGATRMAGGLAPKVLGAASTVAAPFGLKSLPMGALGATGLGLQKAAQLGVPIAGALGTAKLAQLGGDFGGGSAARAGRGGAGLVGYNAVTGEPMIGSPIPPVSGYGVVPPMGDALDVLSPTGLDAGRRLRTIKDAEALRDAQNIILPTVRKYAEQAKRDEFARSIAARGIAQNIATNAALTQNMQQAALGMGATAAQQAGAALTARFNY